jgi:hypothetical protein
MGSRADVLFDCTDTEDCSHLANGVEWYYSESWSWDFAPAGEPVERDNCDTNSDEGTAELRMCWHATPGDGAGYISNGYRCGDNSLNRDSGWERLIFTAE